MKLKLIFLTLLFCTLGCFASLLDSIRLEIEKQIPYQKRQSEDSCTVFHCGKKNADCYDGGPSPSICEPCFETFEECEKEAANDEALCDCITEVSQCLLATNNDVCKYLLDMGLPEICLPSCPACSNLSYPTAPICDFRHYCVAGKCTERIPIGEECDDEQEDSDQCAIDGDILGAFQSRCTNSSELILTCQSVKGISQANDDCETDDECIGNMICEGVCVPLSEGDSCMGNDCAFGLGCFDNICTLLPKHGESCSELRSCLNGRCIDEVCVGDATLKEGETCTTSNSCDLGLWCRRGKCEIAEALPDVCTTDDECEELFGSGTSCGCVPLGQTPEKRCEHFSSPPARFRELYDEVNACVEENQCSGMTSTPGSCFMKHCGQFHSRILEMASTLYPMNLVFECLGSNSTDPSSTGELSSTSSSPTDALSPAVGVVVNLSLLLISMALVM